jgi:exoribonuclease R
MLTQLMNTTDKPIPELLEFSRNKQIPGILEKNVLKALSFYPQLKNTSISFVLKDNIKNSVMQAQPVFRTLLKNRSKRSYRINVSTMFKLTHSAVSIHQLPDEVMIGWLGHELGHIMDYENRSNAGLVSFGYNYYFSGKYVKSAETTADTYAVNQGLGNYLVATKRFILDHAELPQAYKNKIARLYLSPDDIVEQVRKLEESKLAQQKTVL